MASLQQIKSRLTSVATTKKITKAMQLVATAKLQKAQKNLKSIQEYYQAVFTTFQDLLSNVKDAKKLFPEKPRDSKLWIVITSDLGLAGAYNSNVYKQVDHLLRPEDKVIPIGTKGTAHYRAINQETYASFPNAGDEPNYEIAARISEDAIAMFLTGEISEINLVHTKFINSISFETKVTKLLPVEEVEEDDKKTSDVLVEFEPSPEQVLLDAIPLYTSALIFGSMVESKVSEMSSRRTAMENATDNAEDIIEQLDLEYNRARQATITQGITEIVAGADTE